MASGMSGERLERLRLRMEGFVQSGRVAGILTLVHRHGEEVCCTLAGHRDREAGAAITRDTIFRIASMTKPITSVAAMMLVEDGLVRLSDPVEKWLPELANRQVLRTSQSALDDVVPSPRSISVRDLLTHQAGLAYDYSCEGPLAAALAARVSSGPFPGLPPDQFMAQLGQLPLFFAPGTRWNYGLSTDVLGVLIARVSGQPLADFLADRLFGPLGMIDTAFFVPPEKVDRFAVSYQWDPTRAALAVQDHPEQSAFTSKPTFASGGAGLVSTADDYMRFASMLLRFGTIDGKRMLSRKAVELMTSNALSHEVRSLPALGPDRLAGRGFGLGVAVVDDLGAQDVLASPGKYGWPGAYGTAWANDPQEGIVSILMTQLYFDTQREVRPTFENMLHAAIDD